MEKEKEKKKKYGVFGWILIIDPSCRSGNGEIAKSGKGLRFKHTRGRNVFGDNLLVTALGIR